MYTSYLLPSKKGSAMCCMAIAVLFLSSCSRSNYCNTRAIAPTFFDSTKIYGEVFIGQVMTHLGANLSVSPINRAFLTAGTNLNGFTGTSWDAGLGAVPIKHEKALLTVLFTYGKADVNSSFDESPPSFFDYGKHPIYVNANYQKFSSSLYTSLRPIPKIVITAGVRYNHVQYKKYSEKSTFYQGSPKSLSPTYEGRDSIYLASPRSFQTIDPFINVTYRLKNLVSVSFQALYSYHETFVITGGRGYENEKFDVYSTPKRKEYTFTVKAPEYTNFLLNVSLIFHIRSFKKSLKDEDELKEKL